MSLRVTEKNLSQSADGGQHRNGNTILKHTQLILLGLDLVCIPYYEWNAVPEEEKEAYLKRKLGLTS